jgi:hypothetical protein
MGNIMDSDTMLWATLLKEKLESGLLGIGIVYYPHNYLTSSKNIFDSNLKFFLNELKMYYHHTSIGVDYYHDNFFESIKNISETNDLTILTGFENSPLLSPSVLSDTFRMELLYELRDNIKTFGVNNTNLFVNNDESLHQTFKEEYGIDYWSFVNLIDNYSFFKNSLLQQKEFLFRNLHPSFHTQAYKLGCITTLIELNSHPWTKINPTILILPDYLLGFMIALDPTNGVYSLANSQLGVQGFDAKCKFIDSYIPTKGLRYPNPIMVYNKFYTLLEEFSA